MTRDGEAWVSLGPGAAQPRGTGYYGVTTSGSVSPAVQSGRKRPALGVSSYPPLGLRDPQG
jgi:hypothetical protein